MIDYRIKTVDGYPEKIGELVSMLEHTRAVTKEDLRGVSREDLDFAADEHSNTIGALLIHIASIEFVHQVISFKKRDLTEAEWKSWGTALQLGKGARRQFQNHDLEFYINHLDQVRTQTMEGLRKYTDDWLFEERHWENGKAYNPYYLWFHVLEDEINHRGQIRTVKRMIANASS
ncbi:DinB family protein [Halobacillus fulvus]|nr:DinB family protein [Halobacillus fulvus]